ncbi:MAG: aspartate--tRNA ligase [Clostridia bacterium]|nr:aspartate--tRNA ligase [Clostridia bacterium]
MAEFLGNLKRTKYCGQIRESEIGQQLTVMGWVAKRRNLGSLVFVDLRDRTGIIQVVFDQSETSEENFAKAESIRSEYVLAVVGKLRQRQSINPNIPTGRVELVASEFKILSDAETTPFVIDENSTASEALRLKYRYLDLRNASYQERFKLRSDVCRIIRNYMCENDFLEIETPFLGKSTPEGARDYLVPSRVHPGSFYALPQSPQLYKQLLMISGFDRYFQIARCFRDEDLRANRQPEFTQVDMEMSFVDSEEDVMAIAEGLIRKVFKETINYELPENIRRMTWQEAMDRFGSDKPDTRFGLELVNVSDIVKDCSFQVFTNTVANGGSVRLINAKGFASKLSRRDIDALGEFVKTYRAKGLAWMALKEEGLQSPIAKFLSEETVNSILGRANAEKGDILFFVADKNETVYASLGALRLHLAEKAGLINHDEYDILWVTQFPMLEWDEEENRPVAVHHPFTSPNTEDYQAGLLDTAPLSVRAKAYDLVINGQEAGGGSIRIHSRDMQKKMFNVLGFTDEQIEERFGFFVNAFNYGTPPHGGLAFGLDRLVMLLSKTDNIKDVIAFPKVQNASDLMTEAPAPVEEKQLRELCINVDEQ